MPPASSLTADQLSFFEANGYLVMDSFSTAEEVREMRDRMAELVAGFDGPNSAVFSTKDHRQLKDDYFFKSAENIYSSLRKRRLEMMDA